MAAPDATQRFSSRVDNYVRYRPSYPPEVVKLLRENCGLTPDSIIADVASGTGIFTKLLLESGSRVFGVEPNQEMRRAGEQFLTEYSQFTSVAGTAEASSLPDHSVDIVTAAQAAHWFDLKKARQEFMRIGKAEAWSVLLWNERMTDSTPFLRDYEQLLLDYGTDYKDVRHERTTDKIHEFFAPGSFQTREFKLGQETGYAGLEGRLLSSSYAPSREHPRCAPTLAGLRKIFDAHQWNGKVILEYNTRVFYGQLS